MVLLYEDRAEMQRSMKKATVREVFIRDRDGQVRVSALMTGQIIAIHEPAGGGIADEIQQWKDEHFEVLRGEVLLTPADTKPGGQALTESALE